MGRLDLSGSMLRRMAEEQLPMSGADFAKWRKSLGLSLAEAAKLLGVGRGCFQKIAIVGQIVDILGEACSSAWRPKGSCRHQDIPNGVPDAG